MQAQVDLPRLDLGEIEHVVDQLEQMARQAGIDPGSLKGLPSADLPAPAKALPSDVGALLKNSGGPLLPGLGGAAPRFPGLPGLGKKK